MYFLVILLIAGAVAAASWFIWNHYGRNAGMQPAGAIVKVPPALVYMGQPGGPSSLQGPSAQTVRAAEQIAATHPADARALNDAGSIIESSGDVRRGGELLSQAHNLAPGDPVIGYNYARNLYSQGKIDDAIQQANTVLTQKPAMAEARLLLADAAIQKKDYSAAEQNVDQLKVTIKDIQIAAFTIRGVILLEKGKIKEAQDMFQEALKLAGDDATALYNAGVAQQRGNNLIAAQDYYQKALQQDPNLAEAHNNLGTVLSALGNSQAAFDEFHAAAITSPDNSLFAENLSRSTTQAGEPNDKIVGKWEIEGGQFLINGTVGGQPVSQTMQVPAGSVITFTKAASGGYTAQESALGMQISTTFQQQPNGSYSAPTVLPPELARLLPPGITDTGTVSFWVRGQTLFGDTTDTVSGPNTSLKSRRTWKATRVGSTTNQQSAPPTQSASSSTTLLGHWVINGAMQGEDGQGQHFNQPFALTFRITDSGSGHYRLQPETQGSCTDPIDLTQMAPSTYSALMKDRQAEDAVCTGGKMTISLSNGQLQMDMIANSGVATPWQVHGTGRKIP